MARIKITVSLDVDLAEFGAEYGERMTTAEVREHIRSDLAEAMQAAPYAEAIKKSTVKVTPTDAPPPGLEKPGRRGTTSE